MNLSIVTRRRYTRYLGDLFGGQMMGGMARNSLKLDDGKGTKFYEFDDIANTKQCAAKCCRRTDVVILRSRVAWKHLANLSPEVH